MCKWWVDQQRNNFLFSHLGKKKIINTLFHNGSRWVASQFVCVYDCAFVCPHGPVCEWLSVSAFRLAHVCVWERERVGVFVCVDVYLSEQLFQRERISASVIASAIFSTPISPPPPLSLSFSFFFGVYFLSEFCPLSCRLPLRLSLIARFSFIFPSFLSPWH